MDYQSLFNYTQLYGNLLDDSYEDYINISYVSNVSNIYNVSVDPNKQGEEVAGEFYFLKWYKTFFRSINGYLSLAVSFIGTIANIMNIVVLTRKRMESSFNAILLALAVADLFVTLLDIIWVPNSSTFNYPDNFIYSYPLITIIISLRIIYKIFYLLSIWLTVVAAIWRVMAVSFPHHTLRYRSLYRARVAIVTTFAASILGYSPQFMQFKIVEHDNNRSGIKVFEVEFTEFYRNNTYLYKTWFIWLIPIIFGCLPCILVIGLTAVLIRSMRKVNKNRQNLNLRSGRIKAKDRTITMLIIVLIIFLCTHGLEQLINIINLLYRIRFLVYFQYAMQETLGLFILLNSSINFFVYMTMNSQFRETFKDVFVNPCKNMNFNRIC